MAHQQVALKNYVHQSFKITVTDGFVHVRLGKRPIMFSNDCHRAVIRETDGCDGRCQYVVTVVYVHMVDTQF